MKGEPYSYEELLKVFSIYEKVKRSIHKDNQIIQNLGEILGRDTRSVENQLLMFRAYERSKQGKEYGRRNYNNYIPVIYDSARIMSNDVSFPSAFDRFRKSERSSVSRISNVLLSSSPIDFIRTHLHSFIDAVIQDENFLKRKSIIALVGGAGNGKTESLGYILSQIQLRHQLFDNETHLKDCIDDSLRSNKGYFTSFKSRDFRLSYIQDATSVWSQNGAFLSKRESIEKAFECAFGNDTNGVLVICVNRGVLSSLLRELGGFQNEIFELIHNQVNQSGYINMTNNVDVRYNDLYSVSSYPLDKMRLFDGEGVHSQFVVQMSSKTWESNEYREHFFKSQGVSGSLLDALELWNGGLLSFRDYLNYLYVFYAKIHDEDWMNIPLVKIWFANQFETVSDVFDKIISSSPEPYFGKCISKLVEWRSKNAELLQLDIFDPMRVSEIVSSDEVQFLLDSLNQEGEIEVFNTGSREYAIYGFFKELLYKLSRIDNWIDSHSTHTPSDKYRVKRFIFNLTAQVMTFIISEKEELFFLANEKKKFLDSSSNEAIDLLATALDLRRSSRGNNYVECFQSLSDELWVHKEKPSIRQQLRLNVNIYEIISSVNTKPKLPSRVFIVEDNERGSFHIKVDFNQYYYLLLFKGEIQLYHENYSVSFSIWINSLKERLRAFSSGGNGHITVFNELVNINAEL